MGYSSNHVPRHYHKNPRCPRWHKRAPRRVGTSAKPGSERWRRRITEKAYRLRVSGPPISPQDTVGWAEEEYRFLHYLDEKNGICRYWIVVNELAKQDPDHGYKVAQVRYAALRQRLVNEQKLIRVSEGYKLLITDLGTRRLREIVGISPKEAHPYKASRYGNANYDRVGTCGLVW